MSFQRPLFFKEKELHYKLVNLPDRKGLTKDVIKLLHGKCQISFPGARLILMINGLDI